jgi:hypothetical protein
MLKLLRNLVLAAILLAGALKLLAWYAVGHDADRVTAALAPYAQVKYEGLSAGLDGSVSVDNVTVVQPTSHATFHANSFTIGTPGLFWLLKHSLLHETDLPPTLTLNASGIKFPPLPWLDPQFLDPVTGVLFASAGCGAAFTSEDYRRMGAPVAVTNLHSEYHYQPDSHALDMKTTLSTPGYSTITVRGDLHSFDLTALTNAETWEKVRAGQLAVDFADDGFLSRRNQFCMQRLGVPASEFVLRHITAVDTLLSEHRVQPSTELIALYRSLVERGGQATLVSLPRGTFALNHWQGSSPDDLLRQLNITARYRDTPAVMFRLTFTPAPDVDETTAMGGASTTPTVIAATTPTTVDPPATKPPSPSVTPDTKPTTVSPTPIAATPTITKAPPTKIGLHDIDRAEAKLVSQQAPIKSPPPPEPVKAIETDAQYASGPAPPPNSTLALVWKPTIERLPPPTPPKTDFDVIDYGTLQTLAGRRVRLITDGDKRIEGYVLSADAGAVRLRVGRSDGDAQFDVPKKRIREVQLLHRSPPA